MRTLPRIAALVVGMVLVATGNSGEKDKADKLPGAKGPLYEYVGKTGPKVLGADVGVDVNDPNPDKPPKSRTLPSGAKKLFIAVRFAKKPQANSLTIDVYNGGGKVPVGAGVVLQEDNIATGEWTVRMARNPDAGKFDDGPYQAQVKVDGQVVALVNWEVGKAAK
jgi:hypothetical protein